LNIGFALAGLYGVLGEKILYEKSAQISKLLDTYTSPLSSGRNVQISYKEKQIILDYAHEKYSMRELLKFAQKVKKTSDNKVIAVVRLAPDKAEATYIESGEYISPYAESFIVYDKIDGVDRKLYYQE
jgi:UDP-N-acetylmuramyl tripeptide synthase